MGASGNTGLPHTQDLPVRTEAGRKSTTRVFLNAEILAKARLSWFPKKEFVFF
jgi:hypothetical protein